MNPPCLDAEEEEASRPQEPAPATTDRNLPQEPESATTETNLPQEPAPATPTKTNLPPEPQAPSTTEANLPLAPEPVTMERNESVVVSRALSLDLIVFDIDMEVQCFYRRGNLAAFKSNDTCGEASETDEKFPISDSEKGSASSAVKCQDSLEKGEGSKSKEKDNEDVAILDFDLNLLNIGAVESSPAGGNEESSAMMEEAGEGAHNDGSEKNII